MADIGDLTFPTKRTSVPIAHEEAIALLRYVEEVKMYANIEQQRRDNSKSNDSGCNASEEVTPSAFDDPAFLDARHEEMMKEWEASSGERARWFEALEGFLSKLEAALQEFKGAAFIKLSVRSPKDAVFKLASFTDYLKERLAENTHPGSEMALSEDVAAIKYASWKCLQVETAIDALTLLVRSERVYLDILQVSIHSLKVS